MTKRRKSRRSIAIHEAGHAVIAMHVGCRPPTVITTIEDDDAFGRVPCHPPGAWYEPEEARTDARVRRFCERVAMTGLAGVLAEKRLTGRHNHKGAGDDYRLVAHWTEPVCYSPAEHEAYIEWLSLPHRSPHQQRLPVGTDRGRSQRIAPEREPHGT